MHRPVARTVVRRRDPLDGVAWWLLLAAIVGGVVSLAVAWWRWWYDGRWWPWPVTALAFVAVGASLASVLG
jgi:fatty acid desaturase